MQAFVPETEICCCVGLRPPPHRRLLAQLFPPASFGLDVETTRGDCSRLVAYAEAFPLLLPLISAELRTRLRVYVRQGRLGFARLALETFTALLDSARRSDAWQSCGCLLLDAEDAVQATLVHSNATLQGAAAAACCSWLRAHQPFADQDRVGRFLEPLLRMVRSPRPPRREFHLRRRSSTAEDAGTEALHLDPTTLALLAVRELLAQSAQGGALTRRVTDAAPTLLNIVCAHTSEQGAPIAAAAAASGVSADARAAVALRAYHKVCASEPWLDAKVLYESTSVTLGATRVLAAELCIITIAVRGGNSPTTLAPLFAYLDEKAWRPSAFASLVLLLLSPRRSSSEGAGRDDAVSLDELALASTHGVSLAHPLRISDGDTPLTLDTPLHFPVVSGLLAALRHMSELDEAAASLLDEEHAPQGVATFDNGELIEPAALPRGVVLVCAAGLEIASEQCDAAAMSPPHAAASGRIFSPPRAAPPHSSLACPRGNQEQPARGGGDARQRAHSSGWRSLFCRGGTGEAPAVLPIPWVRYIATVGERGFFLGSGVAIAAQLDPSTSGGVIDAELGVLRCGILRAVAGCLPVVADGSQSSPGSSLTGIAEGRSRYSSAAAAPPLVSYLQVSTAGVSSQQVPELLEHLVPILFEKGGGAASSPPAQARSNSPVQQHALEVLRRIAASFVKESGGAVGAAAVAALLAELCRWYAEHVTRFLHLHRVLGAPSHRLSRRPPIADTPSRSSSSRDVSKADSRITSERSLHAASNVGLVGASAVVAGAPVPVLLSESDRLRHKRQQPAGSPAAPPASIDDLHSGLHAPGGSSSALTTTASHGRHHTLMRRHSLAAVLSVTRLNELASEQEGPDGGEEEGSAAAPAVMPGAPAGLKQMITRGGSGAELTSGLGVARELNPVGVTTTVPAPLPADTVGRASASEQPPAAASTPVSVANPSTSATPSQRLRDIIPESVIDSARQQLFAARERLLGVVTFVSCAWRRSLMLLGETGSATRDLGLRSTDAHASLRCNPPASLYASASESSALVPSVGGDTLLPLLLAMCEHEPVLLTHAAASLSELLLCGRRVSNVTDGPPRWREVVLSPFMAQLCLPQPRVSPSQPAACSLKAEEERLGWLCRPGGAEPAAAPPAQLLPTKELAVVVSTLYHAFYQAAASARAADRLPAPVAAVPAAPVAAAGSNGDPSLFISFACRLIRVVLLEGGAQALCRVAPLAFRLLADAAAELQDAGRSSLSAALLRRAGLSLLFSIATGVATDPGSGAMLRYLTSLNLFGMVGGVTSSGATTGEEAPACQNASGAGVYVAPMSIEWLYPGDEEVGTLTGGTVPVSSRRVALALLSSRSVRLLLQQQGLPLRTSGPGVTDGAGDDSQSAQAYVGAAVVKLPLQAHLPGQSTSDALGGATSSRHQYTTSTVAAAPPQRPADGHGRRHSLAPINKGASALRVRGGAGASSIMHDSVDPVDATFGPHSRTAAAALREGREGGGEESDVTATPTLGGEEEAELLRLLFECLTQPYASLRRDAPLKRLMGWEEEGGESLQIHPAGAAPARISLDATAASGLMGSSGAAGPRQGLASSPGYQAAALQPQQKGEETALASERAAPVVPTTASSSAVTTTSGPAISNSGIESAQQDSAAALLQHASGCCAICHPKVAHEHMDAELQRLDLSGVLALIQQHVAHIVGETGIASLAAAAADAPLPAADAGNDDSSDVSQALSHEAAVDSHSLGPPAAVAPSAASEWAASAASAVSADPRVADSIRDAVSAVMSDDWP